MFEKLVVSSSQRPWRTTARFFLGTSALYIFATVGGLVLSVFLADPKLADTGGIITQLAVPVELGDRPNGGGPPPKSKPAKRPDLNNVMKLDNLMSRRGTTPPPISFERVRDDVSWGNSDGPPGPGTGSPLGVVNGAPTVEAPPAPADLPTTKPAVVTKPTDKPVRLPSVVLQGKAVERRTPPYPQLAKQIRLHDSVAVEVVISPEGRVDSARAISGHPMFRHAAEEAARGWRFAPTLLNGVAVRVTGVITFNFKLN